MKCKFCPCQVENSNEIDGYQPNGCFYGDDYLDDYCYEDKDGDCCCDNTKEEFGLSESEINQYWNNNLKIGIGEGTKLLGLPDAMEA